MRLVQVSLPVTIGLLGFLAFLPVQVEEPDTYWHLATGAWMVSHHAIPLSDVFSYTREGAPWVTSEWLSELILYGVHHVGGWPGLHILASLSAALAVASLAHIQLSRGGSPYLAILSAIMAYGLCYTHFWARPHVLAWPLLVWWAAWQADGGATGSPPPWWTLLLMVLWANLHGSFVIGLLLAGIGMAEAIEDWWRRLSPAINKKHWLLYLLGGAGAGLATPYGVEGLLLTQQALGMEQSMAFISEWRSPDFHGLHPFEVWLLLVMAAASLTPLRVSWARWLLVFLLIDTALRHQRNVVLFGLLIPVYLGMAIDRTWIRDYGGAVNRVLQRWPQHTSLVGWCLVTAIAVATAIMTSDSTTTSRTTRFDAAKAVAAVREWTGGRDPGHVFNDYGLGGYLIYAGIKPFIDGRNVVYGDDFLSRYAAAERLTSPSALTDILAQYDIRWTILSIHSPAAALLDHLNGWRRLYADERYVVHVRDPATPLAADPNVSSDRWIDRGCQSTGDGRTRV